MNKEKTKLEKLRELFFTPEAVIEPAVETPTEVEAKFLDAKLENGDVVRIEPALEEGASVSAIDEQGAVAVEDGDYKLEDGTVISVAAGIIVAIAPMEVEADESEVVEENAEMAAATPPKSTIERTEIETKFSAAEELQKASDELIKKLFQEIERLESQFNTQLNEVKESTVKSFELFADEPAAEPVKKEHVTFKAKKKTNSFLGK